jgi:hypothetical protein
LEILVFRKLAAVHYVSLLQELEEFLESSSTRITLPAAHFANSESIILLFVI